MTYRIVILPAAEQQIAGIYDWLTARSVAGAGRWFNRFTEALQTLATDPERVSLAPEAELVGRDVRQLLFRTKRGATYRVIFVVEEADVYILHVRGSGQPLIDVEEF